MYSFRMHLRWPSFRTRSQSRASRRAEATQRSAIEFARGLRAGVRRTCVPSAASTESKATANLASRSRIRKRGRRPSSVSSQVRLRACCVTQPESGLSVQAAKKMRRLSKWMKKRTQSRFRKMVSTDKKVGGDDPGGEGGKEAAPGERRATWRGRDAVPTQDPANGAGRDLDAELAELALEAEIRRRLEV